MPGCGSPSIEMSRIVRWPRATPAGTAARDDRVERLQQIRVVAGTAGDVEDIRAGRQRVHGLDVERLLAVATGRRTGSDQYSGAADARTDRRRHARPPAGHGSARGGRGPD